MLEQQSEQVRECYRLVKYYAQQAEAQTDPKEKQHLLSMKERWLLLARRYEIITSRS